MADFADDAQRITEQDLAAIMANRIKPTEEPDEDENGRYCLICGGVIPSARVIAINAVRCVYCQQRLELALRLKKRGG